MLVSVVNPVHYYKPINDLLGYAKTMVIVTRDTFCVLMVTSARIHSGFCVPWRVQTTSSNEF